ncbi:bacteriophage protein [Mycobacteroides abscessus subsp. massiliense]|nr:bacteriophage protein [Mycobacteroides abscessus subsp. massiliense]
MRVDPQRQIGVRVPDPCRDDGYRYAVEVHKSGHGYTRRVVACPSNSRSMVLNTKDSTITDGAVTQPDGSPGWAFAAATVEIIN